MKNEGLFKNIESKSGVNINEMLKLAHSIQGANLQDEKIVRDIIKKVAILANKDISKDKEDKLVETITKNGQSINMQNITKMMDQAKKE